MSIGKQKEIRKNWNLKASSKSSVRSIETSQILHKVITIGKNNPYTLLFNLFLLRARKIDNTIIRICSPGNPIKNITNTYSNILVKPFLSISHHLLSHFFFILKAHLLSKILSFLMEKLHRSKQ